ncbi:MAG: hypothetical protein A3I44_04660 [Candidatus Sungbacteria bacterium RIFCSPLOWO2_02_FULL_51_17]|uniref:Uncharacterized protein n=1 Tax=Candidatus Sungbacteria bacterium RIFCSPHIGHO2_02_FULL_51_29 TaxID=1802273 RepID=A0A1G2KY73_9BACT|nr:MAG: hypothetical protein A2676_05385 [Candidatus Sungbacteria bacterium RIFCSPHIGHO2_01_FULL_51_22]OHA03432.1 MAG: hypothetical protein A3C16_00115 [Candidatus Sungbacteria bacterium RIFCSPHIGHO2_02_FULL_51_29]OHA07907.1 MAG: hypothetical protein A3B29_04985 [Candidatus Sungbacteria bacterium RIFCSPLOWO2_01_FULL_51_34]OHA12461.1 MAG: hypothetical protein A3I44_04660 [Candidatus Sungbacteria bacterium RIFCSPLOWO2_02_FULL_51_17]
MSDERQNKLPYTSGTFTLDDVQVEKVRTWLLEHARTCANFSSRTILWSGSQWLGSKLTFMFKPHGFGEEVIVVCNCGEKVDVSDEDSNRGG